MKSTIKLILGLLLMFSCRQNGDNEETRISKKKFLDGITYQITEMYTTIDGNYGTKDSLKPPVGCTNFGKWVFQNKKLITYKTISNDGNCQEGIFPNDKFYYDDYYFWSASDTLLPLKNKGKDETAEVIDFIAPTSDKKSQLTIRITLNEPTKRNPNQQKNYYLVMKQIN